MISGTITLVSGNTIEISDENVVAGSTSITMSTCGKNKFSLGTFNSSMLKMGIIDDDALQHEFAGASVTLSDTIEVEGEDTEVALGEYWIDGTTIKRQKNYVIFTAYDAAVKFNEELPDNVRDTAYTPLTLYQAACTAVGVVLVTPSSFPNSTASFKLKSAAIQTWRDAVMWAVQLQSCNAIIDREGRLTIRPAKHASSSEDWLIDATQRRSIQFSDTRIFPKYMDAYSAGTVKSYISTRTISDVQSRKGKIALAYNPLLEEVSETDCDTINENILDYMGNFLQRQVVATLYDNPLIALGELVRFSGGKIDVRRSVLAIVTHIDWKYHGATVVTCTAPDAIADE